MSAGPSFRFRLERIRALRERHVDLARLDLARANVLLDTSEQRLRSVDAELARAREDQRRALAQAEKRPVSADELVARQAFAEHVEARRTAGLHEVERHQTDVAERSSALGVAAREHEMLERLKARQRAQHELESTRREAATLDEIALERFRRSVA